MKTYKVEELTLSEARTLSGVLFHFTDKHTVVSENGLITLLTSSKKDLNMYSREIVSLSIAKRSLKNPTPMNSFGLAD